MTQSPIPNPKPRRLPPIISNFSLLTSHFSFLTSHSSLLTCLLFAFALRLYHLDAQSIWVDEGISLHLATSSLAEIVANRAANIHPPLYFFLLKFWVALTGAPVNVFSARYFSAMASLLQVAVIYAVARRWLGRPTAWVAATLTALSPLSVIYAQEIRAYAILPLVYLALLAITHELTHEPGPHRRAAWLLLGVTEVVGLHLHYTAFFLVAYAGVWLLLAFWREKRWADLQSWLITQLLAGIASLPWLVAVVVHWPDVQAEAQAGTFLAQAPLLDHLLTQVWAFHLTGLAGAVGYPEFRLLAGITFMLLLILLPLRLRQPSTRRTVVRLMAHWLVPLGFALLAWIVRPSSHPRYVALYAPGLTLLVAYAIHPSKPKNQSPSRFTSHISRFTLALSLGLSSFLGLRAYFFDPTFAKDDVRGVARYLEKTASPDDLILIPQSDWSLTFAYQGETPIEMPNLDNAESLWADLTRWTAQHHRIFVMDYRRERGDWPDAVFFALEQAGTKIAHRDLKGLSIYTYQIDHPIKPPALDRLDARFGPLSLTHAWVEDTAPSDTALTLVLHWRMPPAPRNGGDGEGVPRCGLTIRLRDIDGWPLTAHDALLLDTQIRPTDHWTAGQETTTYHVLPIPPGVPPLTYTLAIGLYEQTEEGTRPLDLLDDQSAPQGQWLYLADVRLSTALGLPGSLYGATSSPSPLPQPVDLADGLRLLGARLDRFALNPGQSLFVTLHWRATHSPLPDLRPRLALVQAGRELNGVESAPALGRYPTDRWQAGETVIEHRRLVVPPIATEGTADVLLTVGNQRLVLGQIEISTEEHTFTPPHILHPLDVRFGQVARLIGYDLPSQTPTTGKPITLTLYWQALEGASVANYTVFTHILAADGHLVGQHDSHPVEGARPTLGWVTGEIITDQHVMTFHEPYAGPARLEVGLYNPVTLERVPTEGEETFILLPTTLTILER
ncbi:MAG: glycosyltransferase family 39 protein [Chloroflexota bacterium]|nr:glycosyltransferase family 39 protein [Chloroflexota bacterium]